jgi:hypothetical protein
VWTSWPIAIERRPTLATARANTGNCYRPARATRTSPPAARRWPGRRPTWTAPSATSHGWTPVRARRRGPPGARRCRPRRDIAAASVAESRASLKRLEAGARPEEVSAGRARVAGAEADLTHARQLVTDAVVFAPRPASSRRNWSRPAR